MNLIQNESCRSPFNGSIYTLIPGKILLFRSPSDDITKDCTWSDIDGQRYFGASFYADLLSFLSVSVVVTLDEADPERTEQLRDAFAAAGIDYCGFEDLCGSGAGFFSLQALDRLIQLCDNCPNAIAIHCRDLKTGVAATYLTALMLRRRHFELPSHAAAWIRMAKPDGQVEVDFSLLQGQIDAGPTVRLGRSISFDALPSPADSQNFVPVRAVDIEPGGGADSALSPISRINSSSSAAASSASTRASSSVSSRTLSAALSSASMDSTRSDASSTSLGFASSAGSLLSTAGTLRHWSIRRAFATSGPIMPTQPRPADA